MGGGGGGGERCRQANSPEASRHAREQRPDLRSQAHTQAITYVCSNTRKVENKVLPVRAKVWVARHLSLKT